MNALIIIPARLASTRLPNKPLAEIAGKPMILHVLERAIQAGIGPVVVAAADEEIAEVVLRSGGKVVMTDPNLPSGSDRVYAALQQLSKEYDHDIIINLQGDLPLVDPKDICRVLQPLENPSIDIATLIAPICSDFEKTASSVVKVACAFSGNGKLGRALYFSRATIPWGEGSLWHHVGIYAYRKASLERFIGLPESPLEKREKLEQLRALEADMKIGCAVIEQAPFGVDTPEDLERARSFFK